MGTGTPTVFPGTPQNLPGDSWGHFFFRGGPSQSFQNRHPALVTCNLSYSVAPLRPRGAGVISWFLHVRDSFEIHGDTLFSLGTLPVKSYSRLTAKNCDLTKWGSQAWGWTGHVR